MEESGFSCAVSAKEEQHLAGGQAEIDFSKGRETAKTLGQLTSFEGRVG
jgi:hypothetical protein